MIVRLFEHFEWFYTTKVVNNNDIRNTSKNFFRAILPDFMNLYQIIINKSSAQTFRSGLNYQYLKDKLEIRHDIVHRNGISNDKSTLHIISNTQLYELIEHVDEFVHSLFDEFEKLN